MTYPKRGEIWLLDFEPALGTEIKKERPALIISNDLFNRITPKVTVIPFTGQVKPLPVTIIVNPDADNNLDKESLLRIPDISTFDQQRLRNKIGILNEATMNDVAEKLKIHLNIK
jgi:mRNA interferase MazF